MEAEFDPFFESATFCYLKSGQNGSCIPDVRDQGAKDTCLSFVLTAAVYADSVLIDTRGNPLVGSRQELIDCLHIYAPLENQKLGKVKVTSRGVPNSYRNGLNYIKDIGICFEQDYEFKGSPHVCKEPLLEKLSKGHKIERKIFINDYVQIDVSDDLNLTTMKRYEHVIHQLEIQPVVGKFLITSSFKNLDHSKTPIYMGASASEKREFQEMKRNQTIARKEAEKKDFLEKCEKEDASKHHCAAPISKKSATDKRRHGHIRKEVIEVVNEKVTKEAPSGGHHAALVVGYGELNGVAYFICQNSYGLNWGHKGYFRIAMDAMSQFYHPVGSMYKNINKGTIDRMQERIDEWKAKKKEAERKVEAEWRAEYDSQMLKERGNEKETK